MPAGLVDQEDGSRLFFVSKAGRWLCTPLTTNVRIPREKQNIALPDSRLSRED